jgi:lactoylglutathione lyase
MKFGYIILYVDDVEATLAFYERAFGLNQRMLDDQKNYGELETGGTRLAFVAKKFVQNMLPLTFAQTGPGCATLPFELGLVAANVDSSFRDALAAGAVEVKRPEVKPWGQTVGYVRDLNGILVEICSEMP